MKVFSIMPICARNRPDASLPGCYNQPDPLSSHAAARIRFQKPGPPPELAGRTRTSDLPRLGKRLSTKSVPTFPDTGRGAGLARALAPIGRHMTAPRIADPLGESRRPDCGRLASWKRDVSRGIFGGCEQDFQSCYRWPFSRPQSYWSFGMSFTRIANQ